ncbi:two-component sensor histidine kinase [Streptomyces spiroverticillatus]|uniref:Sensor histidine kinase MtrB n=1 Tax=Streptomyces finlayi TaxID=67296 RepID=A0A918WYP9_9ACTN|nr:MtrAB system histidine kinase MtrB [Streptomyces finlayi]GHA09594.1 two-component sensor histidine kinase [Streptomyces spiroverticillatus]GHC96215.1 two-component sensor histidine kinase [Streptomyces finlayi]
MNRGSAAPNPGEPGSRTERTAAADRPARGPRSDAPPGVSGHPGRRTSRAGRLRQGGRLLQDAAPGGPVLRLVVRLVRRPLLPAIRLWRRNIQLRVVATTLLMSLGVVLLLGFVVISAVSNGLLKSKVEAAQNQARGGFAVAQERASAPADAGSRDGAESGNAVRNVANWRSDLVEQLASGGQKAFNVVALSVANDESGSQRGPRASGGVDPLASVPQELRDSLDRHPETFQVNWRIVYSNDAQPSEPGLIIGKRLNDISGNAYQLYYLFPLTQEEASLKVVTNTLLTAGVFVVVLLGAIAWLVVRQVVTPVRMAAGVAERLSAGRLQERMKVTGEDDIARLGEAFNKMAQNLQLKIQQLEDLSRMQRRFVSDVSHELRTPLTTVRMAADVIHDSKSDFDPVTARSAELLVGQIDRFESLLADLLEISRFDAGAAALEAEPIDLREVVRRVIDAAEPLAERKGTVIRVVGDEQSVVVEADARRVERVLRNLVVNAVEHGEGRDVVVRLGAAQGAVAVAVRDYGVGLKPGEATRVFSRFWRADPARARTTGGTGLGLSIAVEDARLHGGWLQAWGEPGGGSQFRLTLPRTVDEPLRGSPIPLEPEDSRRARARVAEAERAAGRDAASARLASFPVQQTGERRAGPLPAPRTAAVPADPTALPGNGARVVSRRAGEETQDDGTTAGTGAGDSGDSASDGRDSASNRRDSDAEAAVTEAHERSDSGTDDGDGDAREGHGSDRRAPRNRDREDSPRGR